MAKPPGSDDEKLVETKAPATALALPTSTLRALEQMSALGTKGISKAPITSGAISSSGSARSQVPIRSPADLGILLRSVRKALKMSQQEFADLAGVGRRFVSELENGKTTLEVGKVLRVCQAAGIDLSARKR